MHAFILNDKLIQVTAPPGTPLIEMIRNTHRLRGTKLACSEGECGACTVLIGRLTDSGVSYRAITSCISPVVNAYGTHVVTIEGIPSTGPVHQAMISCDATQCGFCTPGFVMSLTGALMSDETPELHTLMTSMDGNICRCTGYKSIVRAAQLIAAQFARQATTTMDDLIASGVLFPYFANIETRLRDLHKTDQRPEDLSEVITGGGTDLYVQKPYMMRTARLDPVQFHEELNGISAEHGICTIGAGTTMTEMQTSPVMRQILPGISGYLAPVGSTQIRNMATLGGNLVNASPIGDLTILFLGLDADIELLEGTTVHTMPLKDFYLGYKKLNKTLDALVCNLRFEIPPSGARFHFERVCKRTYLDVASVNTACMMHCDAAHRITNIHLSAGGVAPIPLYLSHTVEFVTGRHISEDLVREAADILQQEVSPISDIRGSAEYKRLLLQQLFYIHMQRLSPIPLSLENLLRA